MHVGIIFLTRFLFCNRERKFISDIDKFKFDLLIIVIYLVFKLVDLINFFPTVDVRPML